MTSQPTPNDGELTPAAPGFRMNPRVVVRVIILLAIICPCVIVTDLLSTRNRHPVEATAATAASHPETSPSTLNSRPTGVSQ